MAARRRPLHALRLNAARAWLLAGLLLLAQGLGLLHGVAHGVAPAHGLQAVVEGHRHGHAAASAGVDAHAHVHAHGHGPVDADAPLHAHDRRHAHGGDHEAGDAQCRLIDQLAHADALVAAAEPPGLPPATASAPAETPARAPARGGSAAYLARAPPLG